MDSLEKGLHIGVVCWSVELHNLAHEGSVSHCRACRFTHTKHSIPGWSSRRKSRRCAYFLVRTQKPTKYTTSFVCIVAGCVLWSFNVCHMPQHSQLHLVTALAVREGISNWWLQGKDGRRTFSYHKVVHKDIERIIPARGSWSC